MDTSATIIGRIPAGSRVAPTPDGLVVATPDGHGFLLRWTGEREFIGFANADAAILREVMAPTNARLREIAEPYGLANAPWNFFKAYPAQHQLVLIVGEWTHGKPTLEAAQYDGVNFFGWLGGRHNRQTWAWIDAAAAKAHDPRAANIPHLLQEFRPKSHA